MTPESINERDLISASMQGSQIAYRELIQLHQKDVYRFAWAMTGEEDAARRMCENAFITTWRQLKYFSSFQHSFREHLLQLVSIDCEELFKKQRRSRTVSLSSDDSALNFPAPPLRYAPHTNMEHLALQMDLEEALSALPFPLRRILLLHDMSNLTEAQIAKITGSDAKSVQSGLIRAHSLVRRQIITAGGFFPISGEIASESRKRRICADQLPLLAAAADGLCTPQERAALEVHFLSCSGCQNYYDALCAIRHGISVMKHDAPPDMTAYIMHKIQQDSPDHSAASMAEGGKKRRRTFRPAFGRFTIIGLCFALILLAYSEKLWETPDSPDPQPSQSVQNREQPSADAEDVQPTAPEDADPPVDQGDTEPSVPDEAPDKNEDEDPSSGEADPAPDSPDAEDPDGSTPSFSTGGSTVTDSLIPAGEHYCSIQTVGSAAIELLAQSSTASFQATLADGQTVLYYVVPADEVDALSAALRAEGAAPTPYEDSSALDDTAEHALFLVYLEAAEA